MTVRMTGMSGLIDTDALVEASLLRYKTKLNTKKQDKMIQEYKQEQYRTIMKQAREFQTKYLDVLSSKSLFSSSAYNTIKFTSTDSSIVTATGSTKAKAGNYKVVVDSVAEPARCKLTTSDFASLSDKITINNKEFTLAAISDPTDINQIKNRANNLNTQLKNAGIGVTVEYSDFANGGTGGIIFQTEETGENATLSIEKGSSVVAGTVTAGTNATTDYTASFSLGTLDANNGVSGKSVTINGTTISLRDDGYDPNGAQTYTDKVISNLISDVAASGISGITASNISAHGDEIKISRAVSEGAFSVSYNDGTGDTSAAITGGSATKSVSQAISLGDLGSGATSKMLVVNGKTINTTFSQSATDADKMSAINTALNNEGIKAELKKDIATGEYKLYSTETGANSNFSYGIKSVTSGDSLASDVKGTNLKGSITDMDTGETKIIDGTEGYGNTITLDEVTFKIADVTDANGIKITGKNDVTELKDKIVSFVNDYNKLIGAINTKLYEKRDKSYKPLTDEDKEGLTDSQITKLEKKAQEGLLRNDQYLRNFCDSMKNSMSAIMDSGYSLEKIGISPKKDYTTQNGILVIDEDKLTAALEEDPDKVKDLLIGGYTKNDSEIGSSDGVLAQLKKSINIHATNRESTLVQLAGYEDLKATDNRMSKDIEARRKSIAELEQSIKEREDKLYSKYAALESALSQLQAQQSSLTSYFGQS